MNKTFLKFSFLIISLSVSSCNLSKKNDPVVVGGDTQKGIIIPAKDLSYLKINENVLKTRCLQCHSGKDEPNLSTFAAVIANKDKIYEAAINTTKMPKGNRKLTDEERLNLKTWIDSGAPEFAANQTDQDPPKTPVVDPPILKLERPVTWNKVKTEIIDKYCTSCHFAGNKDGVSSYEDYETTKATIGTIFYTVSINPVMPPAPADLADGVANPNQLTRDQKDLLSAWITDGMQK